MLTGVSAVNELLDFCVYGTTGAAIDVSLPAHCATPMPDVPPMESPKV